ncbi:MAG: alginate lyase family protein [Candidatus Sulfotelmatobacter sp.]
MTSDWAKETYRRLRSMDRAESADRVRQKIQSRLDFLRYKLGGAFAPQMLPVVGGSDPRFFFSPQAVSSLCARLRELFPETAKKIVERAEKICQHRFDLLGFESLEYGAKIAWDCDQAHGKCAPRKPWFLIHYLDFDEVGDSKVTWELNRHQHLVTLAKAFRLSGNPRFAQELFLQWEDWHARNPYPIGINWASSLEVAFRSLSWLWVYFLLADSAVMPTNFRGALVRSLAVCGRHIDRYLSTYFSPNTHLLGEAVALFFIGTLCPEIPSARRWQERGWNLIQQECKKQVRSDGLHFEQAIYYQVYALDLFLHAVVLASANQIPIPDELERTIERMLNALAALARGGVIPQLGDDDGGRVFDPARNRGLYLIDPLATGSVLFGRGDFKNLAGGLREETLWLLGDAGIEEFNRIPEIALARESVSLADGGLYVMASDDPGHCLVIDAGPQGSGSAGHGHADALTVAATFGGRDLLIDSGTFEYIGEGLDRDYFRGTSAHNTLTVDGKDQADAAGPFTWQNLPNVKTDSWITGKSFDLFVGSHDGYARLPSPVIHRRFVFSLKSGFWLVRDLALGSGEHELNLFWHLAPGFHKHASHKNAFVSLGAVLRAVTLEGGKWKRRVEQQRHSPVYGAQSQHEVLHFSIRTTLPCEFVTLLLPSANHDAEQHTLTAIGSPLPLSSVVAYRYNAGVSEQVIFFANGQEWSLDGWTSDASFLYAARGGQSAASTLICCNATKVEWSGRRIVQASRPMPRCEIVGQEKPEVASSDPGAVVVDAAAWNALRGSSVAEDDFKLT